MVEKEREREGSSSDRRFVEKGMREKLFGKKMNEGGSEMLNNFFPILRVPEKRVEPESVPRGVGDVCRGELRHAKGWNRGELG